MIVLLLFTLVVLYVFNELYWKRRGLPAGPLPLPVIGNMIEMFSYPPPGHAAFAAWAQKFGKIYTIWMGTDPAIIITGYKELKETFINDADSYSDKMIFEKFNVSLRGGDFGVIDTNGNTWKEHRKFALHTLKDFGMGKEAMEASIQLEVDQIEEELRRLEGKEVNIQEQFDMAIGNIINQFLFGIRFKDPATFNALKVLLDQFFEVQGSFRVYFAYTVSFLPQWMVEFLTPDVGRIRDGIFQFFQQQINEHRREINFDNEDSKDYVETYMKEQKKREAEGDFTSFSDDQLRNMCFDMWVAGMHTTTNTMGFLAAYAINNPDAQKKMQKELSEVIGDRMVTMKDKLNLPYTNAFINEAQRCANLLPMNLPHATTREVTLAGHRIPKGVTVVHQISTVLSDPDIFPEPEKFTPERFIDEAGNLRKVEELVPFSIGKRVCLGEGLARMELFLFTANLFNRFEFLKGEKGLPSLERTYAFIGKAKDYTCQVKSRYSS
ncbi:CBN-CYP-33A1 protein [Caenorhabditis brenneri]|uniref:CBN-CYP-33A1 protein n=1 Tax=Caenorhabditis brenneri TaxID=135651 RepID=G0M9Y2_CAEBE|nr:CBN-CYP-33A1 protein [Caenorhabditis brenneri]